MLSKAFVIMPFAPEFEEIYDFLIKGALEEVGYEVFRADDLLSQSNILNDIIHSISQSQLVIADLTSSNPNVYYELGIAHSLSKPTILLCQDIGEIPFDLRSYRVVPYSIHFTKMNEAKLELANIAREALSGKVGFGNPVSDFLYIDDIAKKPSIVKSGIQESTENGEPGVLDLRVDIEEGLQEIGTLVTEVGEGLTELTPQLTDTVERVNSESSAKKQRKIMQELAMNVQNYGALAKSRNQNYRVILDRVGISLDKMFSGKYLVEKDKEVLREFVSTLEKVESQAFDARQSFLGLTQTMDELPRIEKQFDRAKSFMATEMKSFVENIDQTISILSRAKTAAKGFLGNG